MKAIDSARALDPAGAAARKNHEAGIAPFAQHFSELPHFQRKGLTEHIVSRMKEWVLGGLISPGDRLLRNANWRKRWAYRAPLCGKR